MNIFLGLVFLCIGLILSYLFIKKEWYKYDEDEPLSKTTVYQLALGCIASLIIGIIYLFNLW
jgi:hypothetical protein